MKILLIHTSLKVNGGAEFYTKKLIVDLLSRGVEVRVITGDDSNIKLYNPNSSRFVRYFYQLMDIYGIANRKIVKLAIEYNPDVIHINNWARLRSRTISSLSSKFPTLHTVHDFYIVDPKATCQKNYPQIILKIVRIRTKILMKRFKDVKFHFPADRTKNIFENYGKFKISNFVIFGLNVSSTKVSISNNSNNKVIGFLGKIEEHKGILNFVKIFNQMQKTSLRLFIAGSGSKEKELRKLIKGNDKISYLGELDSNEKEELFSQLSWLVFPSSWVENFPIVCCEALERGIPLIVNSICVPPMAKIGSYLMYEEQTDNEGILKILKMVEAMNSETYLSLQRSALGSVKNFNNSDRLQECYSNLTMRLKPL